jgi:hypothetical protein
MDSSTLHEDFGRQEDVAPPSDRRFGLVAAAVFVFLGCLPWVTRGRPRVWALVVAALFAVIALVMPMLLGPVQRVMQRFARFMHAVMSPVALALLFFMGITPFGALMRLCRHDPLRRGFEPRLDTYWLKRPLGGPAPDTMRNQF